MASVQIERQFRVVIYAVVTFKQPRDGAVVVVAHALGLVELVYELWLAAT